MSSTRQASLSNSKHFERFVRNKGGETVEEIAKKDKVKEEAVRISLRTVEAYRARNTFENANHAAAGVIMEVMGAVKTALEESLGATYEVTKKDPKTQIEETVHEPDHTTRLKGVAEAREILKVIQPKSAGQQIGISVGVSTGDRKATGTYSGMEERLRDIRKDIKERPILEGKVIQTQVLEAEVGSVIEDDEDEE